jgi:hypothetical protein
VYVSCIVSIWSILYAGVCGGGEVTKGLVASASEVADDGTGFSIHQRGFLADL